MRNTILMATGLLLAAAPAFAFGPGGLAHGFSATVASAGAAQALPQASGVSPQRYCAAFGACAGGRSIAVRAAWKAGRDAAMPLDRLTLTSSDVEQALAALRMEINPFVIPAAPAAAEGVDYGVLTGSVPAGQPL